MRIPLKRYLDLLANYLRPQWRRVLALALLLLGSIALQLLNPQILRGFIDTAVAGGPQAALTGAALLFIAVALINQGLSVLITYLGENVGWTATNALRADLAAHCLRLDLSFHKARTPGELIERVDGDVNELSSFFSQFFVHLIGNTVLMLGVLALLFREDWRVGLGLTAFAVLALTVLVRVRALAVPHWHRVRETSAAFFGFLGEQLAGTEDVRSSGATGYVMRRFHEMLRGWLPLTRRAELAGYSMWMITLGVFALGNAAAFGLSAVLWIRGEISIGTVYLIFHYTELLRHPIEQLRTQLQDLQRADASIGRVGDLFNTRSRIVDGSGQPIGAGPLTVEFDGVWFEYDDQPGDEPTTAHRPPTTGESANGYEPSAVGRPASVLRNISFSLAPGRVLGLLGRTGSGKTTLARLLLRLYDPTDGEIRLGGVAARQAYLRELRQRVHIVTQDVQLFNASVRDNLTFFDRGISDERIVAVLHELGLGRWYGSLVAGLDTELESGSALSAGEAQLLAFARAFLADPGLIILDEASSRLDPATEQLIERAIDTLLRGRTAIIIAHRLGTLHRADEVMTLENGQILEHGERARLAADPGSRFAQLLQAGVEEVLA